MTEFLSASPSGSQCALKTADQDIRMAGSCSHSALLPWPDSSKATRLPKALTKRFVASMPCPDFSNVIACKDGAARMGTLRLRMLLSPAGRFPEVSDMPGSQGQCVSARHRKTSSAAAATRLQATPAKLRGKRGFWAMWGMPASTTEITPAETVRVCAEVRDETLT